MSQSLEERKSAWCQPISASAFAGAPSRYDEKYEQLLAETGKVVSVHGDICNWEVVYHCANELTRTKTKDMTVLGALCVSLLKLEGFAGLAAGLAVYRLIVEQHSAELFPNAKRQRGRAGAYTWLTEQLIRELEGAEPDQGQHEAYREALGQFQGLDDLLRPQLGELHPRVSPITRRLEELIAQSEPQAAEPEPVPEPPSSPEPEDDQAQYDADDADDGQGERQEMDAAPTVRAFLPSEPVAPERSPLPETIESEEQAEAAMELVVSALRKLGLYHLERSTERAVGYQLAHLASFVGVVPDGDRAEGGPSPRQLRDLQDAVEGRRWEDVLRAVPEILREGELDLNVEFYLALALEHVGHELALATVSGHALAQYLAMGEMARAGGETAVWLEELAGRRPAAGQEEQPSPSASADVLTEVIAEAERQATRHGLEEGCAVLQRELRQTFSKLTRFRLQLAVASICLKEGAPDLARAILQSLREELEQPVRVWEPDLQVEVVTRLLECLHQLAAAADGDEAAALRREAQELVGLLAQADPAAALRERARWRSG
jgi:type VI secretion system protein VasJ